MHTTASLDAAMEWDMIEPTPVGRLGAGSWLHTDGHVYAHDPATTGMIMAEFLHPGDIVDFPHLDAFTILGPEAFTDVSYAAETAHRNFGLPSMCYPVKRVGGSVTETFFYRPGDMVPVRFAP